MRLRFLVLSIFAFAFSAHAGLFDDDEARRAILDLRQKIDSLKQEYSEKLGEQNKIFAEDNSQLKHSFLEVQSQLDVLRSDLSKLRGQNEILSRELADTQRKLKDQLQIVDDRLKRFEPTKLLLDGREILVEPSEKKDFDASLTIFRRADFPNAVTAFVDFLSRNPQTGYRPSALFWLANAQYATKDYKSAMANFRSMLSIAPDHLRVPEALLAISNCQLELKDTKGARKTLEDLMDSHPSSEAAATAKDRLARFK